MTLEEKYDEESTLLPLNEEKTQGWSFNLKTGMATLATAAFVSGALFVGKSAISQDTPIQAPQLQSESKHSLVAQRSGYDPIASHTLSVYDFSHVVEPDAETVLTLTDCTDCTDLEWVIESLSGDKTGRSTVVYDTTASTNSIKAVFSGASTTFSITVQQAGVVLLNEVVNCKYVRRELRTINEDDLKTFFLALKVMYSTSQEEGTALYGKDYIAASHLTASHASNEYTYHGNMYFLTSHPAMQIRFERSLLSIEPSVVLNYWDFLLDNQLGRDWTSSPIYGEDMFGPVATLAKNDYRPSGYFHDVKMVYDPEKKAFPKSYHSPHGFLGSPEMTTSIDYLTRSNEYCGFRSIEGQVGCHNMLGCFDKFESDHNLREFDICLEERVHANLHMMHAGQWDCAVSWSDFYEEHEEWVDEAFLSMMAVSMSTASLAFKANGYLSCPKTCDGQCTCSSSIKKIAEASDVDKLTPKERFDYAQDVWSEQATLAIGGHEFITLVKDYTFKGTSYSNVFVPVNTKASESKQGEVMDDTKVDLLNTLILKTVLFPGQYSVMMTGAAPADPLFWVMHPIFDKAVHAMRMSPKYNSEGFSWNNMKGDMKWDEKTGFTRLDFEPYLGSTTTSYKFLKNSELWEIMDPTKTSTYYIYDQFTSWGSCDFDPFSTDDDTDDDSASS